MSMFFRLLVLLMVISSVSCESDVKVRSEKDYGLFNKPVSVKGQAFVDGYGRQIIFNGINLVNKNPNVQYIGNYNDPEIFKNFKKWGFNVIRLGIIWDGLEPEPGVYNEEYLKGIDEQIELARKNGLFVFLDMHQDLYSRLYSDGAPAWATLNEGKLHRKGTIWSDSYLISPAVQTAWDNFWNNTPASDSVGLQDHYARAWKHVAERYKGNNTVIGYDVMNEPFVGSEAQMYMPFLFRAFSEVTREEAGRPLSMEEIARLWSDQDTRYDALRKIADKEKYKQVINSVYKINSKFEKGLLQNFYQKVADSIRSVDTEKIFFFNHSYFCNMGVPTALEPVKLKNGKPDPNVSYAAHGYDLLVDTKYLSSSSYDRLDLIFETIYESGKRMKVPVMIGEWGALGKDAPGRAELAEKHLELFEKYKFSNTYWAYEPKLSKRSYFKALLHPYPSFISGNLMSYKYDHTTGEFTCKWKESEGYTMPTSIFIPDLNKLDIDNIHVHPEGDGIIVEAFKVGKGGSVIINPMKPAEVREITFTIRNGEEKDIPLIYIN